MNTGDLAWKGILEGLRWLPSLLKAVWPIFLIAAAKFAFECYMAHRERTWLRGLGIQDIDKLSGREFEKFLEVHFQDRGYAVERTSYVGDWGADLVLHKDGQHTVVQAKRYKGRVGVKAVQEVCAAKGKYRCSKAMVITNSTYTRAAEELAYANGVELWGRRELLRALRMVRPSTVSSTPTPPDNSPMEVRQLEPVSNTAPSQDQCSTCGRVLTPKVAAYCRNNAARFQGRLYCYDHQRF